MTTFIDFDVLLRM